jgi:hypothetical protein
MALALAGCWIEISCLKKERIILEEKPNSLRKEKVMAGNCRVEEISLWYISTALLLLGIGYKFPALINDHDYFFDSVGAFCAIVGIALLIGGRLVKKLNILIV